jgi:hypothetical protein
MTTNSTTWANRVRAAASARGGGPQGALGRLARLPPAFWVGVLCLAIVLVADALIIDEHGLHGDDLNYERMATDPGAPHNIPYAYRIAVPWLVHVLPFSHTFSFSLLAWLAAGASGGVLYALLRDFDIGSRLSVALAIGLVVSPPMLVVSLRQGRNPDAASVLVLLVGALFIVRRRRIGLALTLIVGVLVRESTLFLIPMAYAYWAEKPIDAAALRDTAAVAALPAIAYAAVRSAITAVGQSYEPGYSGPFFHTRLEMLRKGVQNGGWHLQVRRLASVFGPLWLAAPFALRDLRFARAGLVLIALCGVATTYALDWGRVFFLATPVVYVAAAHVVRHRRGWAAAMVAALLALDLGYAVYMQVHGVRHGIDGTSPSTRPIP